jgi:signal transduction histidine kinase/DNA-binding response OmpR family regulator
MTKGDDVMPKEKILIVEDERVVAMDIQNRLKVLGYSVCGSASSGKDAVKKASELQPDLILMDIVLKGDLDGIDAAGQIRERFNIPVVYLTAFSDEKTLQRARLTGPYGYILKPFEDSELRSNIEIALYKGVMDTRIEHLNRIIGAIRSVNQLIVREKDPDRLIQDTCDNLIATRGFSNAWIALLDENKEFMATAEAGLGEDFLPMTERLKRGELPECAKRALARPDVVVIKAPSAICTDCPLVKTYHCRGAMSIRMEHGGKMYGLLTVSTPIDFMTEEELSLFKEIAGDISFALHAIEIEKERNLAEEALQRSEMELRIRNRIANIFLTIPDKEMYGEVLQVILEAMESKSGIFGYIDEQGSLVCPSMTRNIWDQYQIPDKNMVFPREMWVDIWSRALIEKKPLYSNEPLRVPEGHVPIHRVLVVPIIYQGKVIGLLQVANKPSDYDEKTLSFLENLVGFTAPVLNARLQRDRQEGDKKKLEAQLFQSQKMEAIGTLAGGIAHDFNNLLSVIIGNAELFDERIGRDDPNCEYLDEIKHAGHRATTLVRQLLAFSRKQIIQPKVISLNDILMDFEKMLERIIGEDVNLEMIKAPGLRTVKMDPGQVEQVIMNLAVNARDAMPKGGNLTIETANVNLDTGYFRNHGVKSSPGPYVMLAISDSGCGMDEKTRLRAFEPFFTTKEKRGTGLGLSTVYGIIKQNEGHVWVYSEPGQGTTIKIYLPRAEKDTVTAKEEKAVTGSLMGSETILVVEDDKSLRKLSQRILEKFGYKVIGAKSGKEAMSIIQEYEGHIQLVLTDVVMPEMSGAELAKKLLLLKPELKMIYMSGYTDNAIAHHGLLVPHVNFIEKPFSPGTLAGKVREMLDKQIDN